MENNLIPDPRFTIAENLKANILIVDDQAANLFLLEQLLRSDGYCSIASTRNPHEVCDLHRRNHYDLIILNLQMPGMDGFQVMEKLKEIGNGRYLPILAVSAQPDQKFRALQAGAKDFVSMPFDLAEILIRIANMVEDITARKRLNEQIRQTQKIEAMGTLAGGIAHDFNNILAAINGYTELARIKLKGNSVVREHLDAVLQAASRATDLVRQILTFSSQRQQERRPIQLGPVVVESLKLLRATIPATIEFDLSLAGDGPTVLADSTQVHQILMNLGTNAWHAMKDRTGRLQVKLEKYVVDEARAAGQPRLRKGNYAHLSFGDSGSGMDPATLRRIFEPYFTTKPLGEGTGLGLAVVHGIMDSHEGAVTVCSQPGEGTLFHLYFPEHIGAAPIPAVADLPVPRGRGERLLLVDDEELLVRLGQMTLTALGYQVEVATKPAEALAMVRADPHRFALVLTDQTMPGTTGLTLASQLHQIRPGLPILLMTGYSASLTAAQSEASGITQLLFKPTSILTLGIAVHTALSANPLINGLHTVN